MNFSSSDFVNVSFPKEASELCITPNFNITLASDQTLMTAGYTIPMFLSLTGNALVIGAFYRRYDQLQTPVNYFIINMAVSDLLVPFFVFPKHIQEVYLGWGPIIVSGVLGDIVCKITSFAEDVSASVSSQSMLFIAAERFSSIVIPQKWPLISRQTTPRFLGFTWVFSSVFFSYCFYLRKVVDDNERTLCTYKLPQGFDSWQELWKTERLTFLVGFVAIPFIIMVIFYTVIVVTLHRQVKAALSEVQKRHVKQTQRVTLMLISVVAVFFISWIPFYIYFCLHFYSLDINLSCNSMTKLWLAGRYVNYIYTAFNPLIYYTFNAIYRQGFHELLSCGWRCYPRFCRKTTVEPGHPNLRHQSDGLNGSRDTWVISEIEGN